MGTMGTMGTMVLQNTVDKLIKKTNLATVIGTHSWREQFLEAITVSAGASPRHRTGGAPNRGDTHHGDTQPWGHPTVGTPIYGGHPTMGDTHHGDTQLWEHPTMGDTHHGDTQPWGPSPGGHVLPHGGHSGVNGDPLGSSHAHSSALGDTLGPMGTL